jgi:hypothetical protein
MSVHKRIALPTFPLACALALALVLALTALAPHGAAAQGWNGTVRDHRARECRVAYSEHPSYPGFPAVIGFCALAASNTHTVGSFCTCSKLIEGHYQTVGGRIVLVSAPNG